ncbi:MAG: efflux RND transporter permease subunit [Verrucomicrobiales bacterium]|nr:efflux RND transporter permease subunit [Verrucomicrobiales bacterium]
MIAWFARNGVAANLLLVVIAVGGLLGLSSIRKEIFPEFSSDMITVSVIYRGASPEEVEEAVCVRVEEAIQGLEGIKRIRSTANEGAGVVTVELLPGADNRRVLDDVKSRVDAIDTFPEETDKPVIQEVIMRTQVINVAVSGEADELTLKRLGERVRDELSNEPGISQVQLAVARPYEISIEVSEEALRRYGLTFDEVARAVRFSSLDLPGGSIKTAGGEFLLRVKGQAYRAPEFEQLPLRSLPNGSRLLLGDVATVVDGFEDNIREARFNGKPGVVVLVFRVGDENALDVAQAVKDYVKRTQPRMPEGIRLTTYADYSQYLRSRMELLLRNARLGFILVFFILALFLRLRLAFWVSIGIPISFLGTLWLMPTLDVSINMISLFAFLLVLGIVVDDAIVVGENVYSHYQSGKSGLQAAIDGAREMAVPVVFAVLTTVAAFSPLLMVEGNTGKVMRAIPLIVIPTLLFSLVECMFCVPNHLSHFRKKPPIRPGGFHPFRRLQEAFARGLAGFIEHLYTPFLDLCLRFRYVVLSVALASLMVGVGLVAGGYLKFQFFPAVEGDDIAAFITMPEGASPAAVEAAVRQVEQAAEQLQTEYADARTPDGRGIFYNVLASVGDQPYRSALSRNGGRNADSFARPNVGELHIQLAPSEERPVSSTDIVNRWRELTGEIPGVVELVFTSSLFTTGDAINVQLTGPDVAQLRMAAEDLKTAMGRYDGVLDIADSYRSGKQEIKLAIKPSAEAAGLTLQDLARQVRQAFYGEEAQRIQRGRDDVRVMVRYPERERRSLANLEQMRVRLPDGTEVPFSAVAEARAGQGYATINRVDRRRAINVTADVDLSKTTSKEVVAQLLARDLPALLEKYPGLRYGLEGEQREQQDTMQSLMRGFVMALFLIFALIAVPLKSYIHPFVVMSAIPFGFFGAIMGHIVMGMMLTVLSMFGFVALAGVAVNDTLVLVDSINAARRAGTPLAEAVRNAGRTRFRPILLTSLTTFAGLTPLILEKSVQAQFLIPMAISLGFGVLYCTFTSLLLVPALYLIIEDVVRGVKRAFGFEIHLESEEHDEPATATGG